MPKAPFTKPAIKNFTTTLTRTENGVSEIFEETSNIGEEVLSYGDLENTANFKQLLYLQGLSRKERLRIGAPAEVRLPENKYSVHYHKTVPIKGTQVDTYPEIGVSYIKEGLAGSVGQYAVTEKPSDITAVNGLPSESYYRTYYELEKLIGNGGESDTADTSSLAGIGNGSMWIDIFEGPETVAFLQTVGTQLEQVGGKIKGAYKAGGDPSLITGFKKKRRKSGKAYYVAQKAAMQLPPLKALSAGWCIAMFAIAPLIDSVNVFSNITARASLDKRVRNAKRVLTARKAATFTKSSVIKEDFYDGQMTVNNSYNFRSSTEIRLELGIKDIGKYSEVLSGMAFPMSSMLEVIPLSFVAFWFYDIGASLKSLELHRLEYLEPLGGYCSQTDKGMIYSKAEGSGTSGSQSHSFACHGSHRFKNRSRMPFKPKEWPVIPPPKLRSLGDLAGGQLVSLGALVHLIFF